jgi:hypothetical protein
MDAAKIGALLSDLVRVNFAYLGDSTYRNTIRERLSNTASTPLTRATAQTERRAADSAALAFDGLAETSLSLAGIRVRDGAEPHLNLVVGEIRDGAAFAGIETALTAGVLLAGRLGLPLRILMVSYTTTGNSSAAATAFVERRMPDARFVLHAREDIPRAEFSPGDHWLATHWKTAHAIDVSATSGRVNPTRVVYLMQDYEPGFSPWSTEYAVAASTYRKGYAALVNSTPLRSYLSRVESLDVPVQQTFGPHLDLELLRRVAGKRRHEATTKVLFYARPSKHRNLFGVGVAALRLAAARLQEAGVDVEYVSAGELHRDVQLGASKLTSLGTLPWDDYFDLLASANVVLSLQFSPHPSHPPFDGAISGARVVTNEFEGTRGALHDRIAAVPADPASLADALVEAVLKASTEGPGDFRDLAPGALGGSLTDAVEAVATTLEVSP